MYDFTYMWNLNKHVHRYRKQSVVARGGGNGQNGWRGFKGINLPYKINVTGGNVHHGDYS